MYESNAKSTHARLEIITDLLASGEFVKAKDKILDLAEFCTLFLQGSELVNFISQLPDVLLDKDPKLLLYKGIALSQMGDKLEVAAYYLRVAEASFKQHNDFENQILAKLQLGFVYYLDAKYTQAFSLLSEIDQVTLTEKLKAKHNHYLLLAYFGMDDYAKAIEAGEKAIQQYETTNNIAFLPRLLRHCSYALNYLENFEKSLCYQKRGLKIAQDLGFSSEVLAWAYFELAKTYTRLGRFEETDRCLTEAENLLLHLPNVQISEYIKRARGDWYHAQHQYTHAIDSYKTTIDALTTAMALDAQDILDILVTQPTKNLEFYEFAIATLRDYKHIESVVDRAHFHVLIGLAALGADRVVEAKQHFEKAECNFDHYKCYSKLTSVNFYLAKVYYLFNNKQKYVAYLKKSLDSLAAQECFNLDWWQPWTVAEMCVVALREGIQIGFVERWMMRRLSEHEAHYFYPLLNHADPQIRELALRLLKPFPQSIEVEARQLLENDKIYEETKARFVNWLDSGWLTPLGLISLKNLMRGWRRLEIMLLWICPHFQGSKDKIADLHLKNDKGQCIKPDTIGKHLDSIRDLLRAEKILASDAFNVGLYALTYQWAIQKEYINPKISHC